MKNTIVILLSSVLCSSLYARDLTGDEKKLCSEYSKMAEKTMELRQAGVSMATFLGMLDEVDEGKEAGSADKAAADMVRGMVMRAYKHNRYSSEKVRKRTIEDFRDAEALGCYTSFSAD